MNQRVLILAFAYLFYVEAIAAQVGFSIPFVNNATNSGILDLPVTVSGFDSVVSVQFVIRWDPQVLQFQDVGQFNLPDLNASKFGTTEALDSGIMRVLWWFPTDAGTTLSDGSHIFHLRFKVTGPVNSGTSVYITQLVPLTYYEVVKANGDTYTFDPASLDNGFVAVGYTVGTLEWVTSPNIPVETFPNPFKEKTTVFVTLQQPDLLHVKLFDSMGRLIFHQDRDFPAGRTGMEIVSNVLQRKGTYLLLIQSEKVSHVERLIFSE